MADTETLEPTDEDAQRAELEQLRQFKQQAEQAQAREQIIGKVSEASGIPATLLNYLPADADEDTLNAFAHALDQFAHPKPQGMPNQGMQPNITPNATLHDMQNALFHN